jgi:membrane peptidoglycan carboxypeptidase
MCEGVEPIEMALAYSAFPGEGDLHSPICYTKVIDRKGEVILEGKSEVSEAINEGVAFIMTDVLESVVKANGYIHLDNVQAGGKTGTTNERYDIWFDGFTPSYAASLWIGTDQNVEMDAGSYPCAVLWGKIMNQIPKALVGTYPAKPDNVVQKGGEYFTSGTETGLSSWSSEDEKKKARAAAKKKWQSEREKHKKWVVDVPGHYETIHHDAEYATETYTETETYQEHVGDTEIYDEEGNVIGTEPVYETRTREVVKERQVLVRDAYDEQGAWIEEKGHWEYEKGYRDGDFSYKN